MIVAKLTVGRAGAAAFVPLHSEYPTRLPEGSGRSRPSPAEHGDAS
ncbi:hypothetical protein [Streptomyces sp. B6B3]